MIIETCVICGNLFQKTAKEICLSCLTKTEDAHKTLRIYLKRRKVSDLQQVSDATGISLNIIHQVLQEGRISLYTGSTATYPCKSCGKGIQTGGICTKCVDDVYDFKKSLEEVSNTSTKEETEQQKKSAFHSRANKL